MSRRIFISAGPVTMEAELNDSTTASMVWDALPLTGQANTWGDEIYFRIPVDVDEGPDAREEVEVGELGYWPTGSAFCIFFGPTPASTGGEPRAASPVNPLGHVLGEPDAFKAVPPGATVMLERGED